MYIYLLHKIIQSLFFKVFEDMVTIADLSYFNVFWIKINYRYNVLNITFIKDYNDIDIIKMALSLIFEVDEIFCY